MTERAASGRQDFIATRSIAERCRRSARTGQQCITACRFIDTMIPGGGAALPAARRRCAPAHPAAAGRGAAERRRADVDPGHRAVGRVAAPRACSRTPASSKSGATAASRSSAWPRRSRTGDERLRPGLAAAAGAVRGRGAATPEGRARRGAPRGSPPRAEGELRRGLRPARRRRRTPADRAGPELGGVGARARPPAAAARRRRSRLRRGLPDDRGGALREAGDRDRSVRGRPRAGPRSGVRRPAVEEHRVGSAASWSTCRSRTPASTWRCSRRRCTTPPIPTKALAEAARIVRPGGRVLVLELRHHDERWVRERLGDKWLGFDDDELERLLERAGLTDIKVTVGARRQRDPFTVLIASGVKAPTRHAANKEHEDDEGHDRRQTCQTHLATSDIGLGHRRRARSSGRSRSASSSSTARWGR